ncbi:family 2A encapsulin nanocompartment shell protein [Dactylosporangium sp. CA-139114]|uniref:family 2A encapsulin nanocompartment shell protein n=1 Tax=Dactylosporangium sp. CA-139114 TaxID=3239931 RepID=UPI003D99E939
MTANAQPTSGALGDAGARQLADTTKPPARMATITPRWLIRLLEWVAVEGGVYRLNKVRNAEAIDIGLPGRDQSELTATYVDYEDAPREYYLHTISTILRVHARVSDLYQKPHDQISEQLRLTIETMKERQESELINSADYGLLATATSAQRVPTMNGTPTPDDLDGLIAKVWKEPAFFLTHPRAIAAFGRECTRRGVPPPTVSLFGAQFLTWRGLPLVPTDKMPLGDGRTSIILLRVGEERQGVVGLYPPILEGQEDRGLSVRFMGIDERAITSYLISLYSSLAVLTDDAIAVLDEVEVDKIHDYPYHYR